MENKVLNIKLEEREFKKILLVIGDKISILTQQLNDLTNQDELLNEIFKLKILVAKLQEAKLYNE